MNGSPSSIPVAQATGKPSGPGKRRLVGARCVRDVPVLPTGSSIAEALSLLCRHRFLYSGHVAVVDDASRLLGVAPAERLVGDGALVLEQVMEQVPSTLHGAFEESAVTQAVHAGARVLAVTDDDGRFQGLLPPEEMLRVLTVEHDEDLSRLGGYLTRTAQVRSALEERLLRRLWHRTPWLLMGLLGAMASALLTAGFEEQLADVVAVAFFVPAVVYLADAVGTQTEALVIRGISLGVPLRRILWQESATGTLIGLVLGAAFFPFALVVGGSAPLGVAVALSLAFGAATATLVAMILPYLFAWRGKDPAFGSGPLATVIQDLLSITLYLGLVVGLVGT